jgi:hypothetical protein
VRASLFPKVSSPVPSQTGDLDLQELHSWFDIKDQQPLVGLFSLRAGGHRCAEDIDEQFGVVLDHDAGTVSFDTVVYQMQIAEIECVVRESPTPGRWHLLAPVRTSLHSEGATNVRDWLRAQIGRLQGVIGEVCASTESVAPGQVFYIGTARVGQRFVAVKGSRRIDEATEVMPLMGTMPKRGISGRVIDLETADWKVLINEGADYHAGTLNGAYELFRLGKSEDEVVHEIELEFNVVPKEKRDSRWLTRFEDVRRCVKAKSQWQQRECKADDFDWFLEETLIEALVDGVHPGNVQQVEDAAQGLGRLGEWQSKIDEAKEQRREVQRETNKEMGEGIEDPFAPLAELGTMVERFRYVSVGGVGAVAFPFDRRWHLMALPLARSKFAASRTEIPDSKGKMRKVPTLDLWLTNKGRRDVPAVTWAIGHPRRLGAGSGLPAGTLNLWSPTEVVEAEHPGLELFLEHVAFVFGDRSEDFLRWLAHCQQKPQQLPHWGWLHIAQKHGVGRNWIASVLTRVWAGEVAASLDLGFLIESQFNNRLSAKRLAVVDEIYLSESGRSRYTVSSKVRELITSDIRRINGKHAVEIDEVNTLRWLIFSNHLDGLPLDSEDRRLEVVVFRSAPRDEDYYRRLYGLLGDPGFIAAVRWHLQRSSIAGFNAGSLPKDTKDRREVIKSSRSPFEADVADDILGRTFITTWEMVGNDSHRARQWSHVVQRLGLKPVTVGYSERPVVGGRKTRVYMVRSDPRVKYEEIGGVVYVSDQRSIDELMALLVGM